MREKTYSFLDVFNVEREVIEVPKKKKRKKALHFNLLKETRKSTKKDYFNKEYVFYMFCRYKRCEYMIEEIKNRTDKNKTREFLEKNKIEIYNFLVKNYVKLATNKINHMNFRSIPQHIKTEMINDAVMRGLESGSRETNENFGTPYILRFDEYRSKEIFSYWTQQVSNFFIQYLISEKNQTDIKHLNLQSIISKFNQDWGKSGIRFNVSTVIDKE